MASHKDVSPKVTWEPQIAQKIADMLKAKSNILSTRPLLVGVAGIPGAGKTTGATILQSLVPDSIVIPVDGYHKYKSELLEMPKPDDAVYRRGAPDTFSPEKLHVKLTALVCDGPARTDIVKFPSFDHAVADPVEDDIVFERHHHRVVIFEGLYLFLDTHGWGEIARMWDLKVFVDSDIEVCIARLKIRNQCIPGYSAEEMNTRCDVVDRTNGQLVISSKGNADYVVQGSSFVAS